ncbi:hypothetical protein FCM35_KLT08831 [Carex littledalei]|uniref:Uncharacterized protein n=1 Tax=Carex littledalei TaxID=544730 RepID=A0A833V5H3_9POAL|nr:hypothetical protein FCM35_KLT08831 [Carex littledalei]
MEPLSGPEPLAINPPQYLIRPRPRLLSAPLTPPARAHPSQVARPLLQLPPSRWIDEPIAQALPFDTTPAEEFFQRVHRDNVKAATGFSASGEGSNLLAIDYDTIHGIYEMLEDGERKNKLAAILKNSPTFTLKPIRSDPQLPTMEPRAADRSGSLTGEAAKDRPKRPFDQPDRSVAASTGGDPLPCIKSRTEAILHATPPIGAHRESPIHINEEKTHSGGKRIQTALSKPRKDKSPMLDSISRPVIPIPVEISPAKKIREAETRPHSPSPITDRALGLDKRQPGYKPHQNPTDFSSNFRAQFMPIQEGQLRPADINNPEYEELGEEALEKYLTPVIRSDQTVTQPPDPHSLPGPIADPIEAIGSNSAGLDMTEDEGYASYASPNAFDMDLAMWEAEAAAYKAQEEDEPIEEEPSEEAEPFEEDVLGGAANLQASETHPVPVTASPLAPADLTKIGAPHPSEPMAAGKQSAIPQEPTGPRRSARFLEKGPPKTYTPKRTRPKKTGAEAAGATPDTKSKNEARKALIRSLEDDMIETTGLSEKQLKEVDELCGMEQREGNIEVGEPHEPGQIAGMEDSVLGAFDFDSADECSTEEEGDEGAN